MDRGGEASMSFSTDLWSKFCASKEFREEYVAALAKRAFALQVRTIRKDREMSQEQLADAAKIDQGVISRAENPNNGITFNTAIRISAGFDLAFIPQLVTYSEFLKWAEKIGEGIENLKSFEKERKEGESPEQRASQAVVIPKMPSVGVEENIEDTKKASSDVAASGKGGKVLMFPENEEGIPRELLSKGVSNEIIRRGSSESAGVC